MTKHTSRKINRAARRRGEESRPLAQRSLLATHVLPMVGLFVLTLIVFAPVTSYPFLNWDDMTSVVFNPAFNPPTTRSLLAYWTQVRPGVQFFVPVTHTLWWLIAAATGTPAPGGTWRLEPAPFHVANW